MSSSLDGRASQNIVSLKFKLIALYIILYFMFYAFLLYVHVADHYQYDFKYEGFILIALHVLAIFFMIFYLLDVKTNWINFSLKCMAMVSLVVVDMYEIINSMLTSYDENFPLLGFVVIFYIKIALLVSAWSICWEYANGKTCNGLRLS